MNKDSYILSKDNVSSEETTSLAQWATKGLYLEVCSAQMLDWDDERNNGATSRVIVNYQLSHGYNDEKQSTPVFELNTLWVFDRKIFEHSIVNAAQVEMITTAGVVAHQNGLDPRIFAKDYNPDRISGPLEQARAEKRPLERLERTLPDGIGDDAVIDGRGISIDQITSVEALNEEEPHIFTVKVALTGPLGMIYDGVVTVYSEEGEKETEQEIDTEISVDVTLSFTVDVDEGTIEYIEFDEDDTDFQKSADQLMISNFIRDGGVEPLLNELNLTEEIIRRSPNYENIFIAAQVAFSNQATTLNELSMVDALDGDFLPTGFRVSLSDPKELAALEAQGLCGETDELVRRAHKAIEACELEKEVEAENTTKLSPNL